MRQSGAHPEQPFAAAARGSSPAVAQPAQEAAALPAAPTAPATMTPDRLAALEQLVALGGPDWRHCSRCQDVDGLPVHYLDCGDGPPVVLLHGFGAWAYSWRHNIDALAARHRVIVPDLKGFGLSGRDRRHKHGLTDQARLVLTLLDRLGLRRAALVGNSMGGEISLRAALLAPERVAGLGLICSSGTFTVRQMPLLRRAIRIPGFARWLTHRLVRLETVRRAVRGALGDPSRYNETDAAAYWLPLARPGAADLVAALARDADFGAVRDRLSAITAPALIVWGERDSFIPLAHGQLLAELLPNSRLVVLPGLGHSPQEESPEEVNDLLLDFLSELAFA